MIIGTSVASVLQRHTPTMKTTTPYLCGIMKQGMSIFIPTQFLMVYQSEATVTTALGTVSYTLLDLPLAQAGSGVLDWPTCPILERNTCSPTMNPSLIDPASFPWINAFASSTRLQEYDSKILNLKYYYSMTTAGCIKKEIPRGNTRVVTRCISRKNQACKI